ncbi:MULTISPECIES: hypothetical protein [unclassified Lysinibacillus]|uniref:hypothetical protein n=1 Tax=unclassified Lysinibacillus TaxID=2636778 RepID=UPI00201B44ED|nr:MULTISPECIES: hypothetical protein [unclassified Lysinibacillus]WCH47959.1 hypothetical protein NV349_00765 [Lysinibacillus sp. OF-1]
MLTIHHVSKQTGLLFAHYEEIELLLPTVKAEGGQRIYGENAPTNRIFKGMRIQIKRNSNSTK